MGKFRNSLALCALLFGMNTEAQITVVGTTPGTVFPVKTLNAGIKLMDAFMAGSASITLYNLDLTVYRVLVFPAPPAGMEWQGITYITEALFDTDTATIEFALRALTPAPPMSGAIHVAREDGTTLLSKNPGHLAWASDVGVNESTPVFAQNGQSYMLIHQPWSVGPVTVYTLPGTLPCKDCYGSPIPYGIALGGGSIVDPVSGMSLQPNPAHDELQVSFDPLGALPDAVSIIDATGREVLRQGMSGGRIVLQVAHLSSGIYTVLAITGMERIGALPLVINR